MVVSGVVSVVSVTGGGAEVVLASVEGNTWLVEVVGEDVEGGGGGASPDIVVGCVVVIVGGVGSAGGELGGLVRVEKVVLLVVAVVAMDVVSEVVKAG